MHKIAKHSLKKLVVLWTILLLFTPCTIKQSLKEFLGLPVSTLYTANQANKLRSCPEIRVAAENQTVVYVFKKQIKNLHAGNQAAFPDSYKQPSIAKPLHLQDHCRAYAVPIYILYDQLLI